MKQKPKSEQLLEFIKSRPITATHDIIAWGVRNFYNRADRTARDFATAGLIHRIDESEIAERGLNPSEGYYEPERVCAAPMPSVGYGQMSLGIDTTIPYHKRQW